MIGISYRKIGNNLYQGNYNSILAHTTIIVVLVFLPLFSRIQVNAIVRE